MITWSGRITRRLALAGIAAVVGGLVAAAPASSAEGKVLYASHPQALANSFIVVLADGPAAASSSAVQATASSMTAEYGGKVTFTYSAALNGFAVKANARQARRLAADPRVDYVAQDQRVRTNVSVQPNPPSWGLDRIDQRSLPLDNKYHYPNTAPNVRAYIIDTGIHYTHQEFGGRAVFGFDAFGGNGADCHGHGTHVAGTVGGRSVGVAKQVALIAVRVLDCGGGGSYAGVIAGVNWVTADQANYRRGGVANMSLGGGFFQPLNDAVDASMARNVHYSLAAGNNGGDACATSPASTLRATTVSATDINDVRPVWGNFGNCVDLFAPGVSIYSAWHTANNAYNTISGTSMAAPHSTGTAALWRQKFPADNADQVATALVANATPGVVANPMGSPNLLLFMAMIPV